MFAIFGRGMGPAELTSATAFPLPTELSETSVQISLGGATLKCFMVFTSAGQIAAILPSSAVRGEWRITVTYRGETSAPQPIQVAASAVGIFTIRQSGAGPAVVTDADFAVNTAVNAFAPGQTAIVWVTGLGARSVDNFAGPEDLKDALDVEVGLGGVSAKVLYAGPSGCCPGVDQVIFEIPSLPEDIREGCHVPVVVRAGESFSNFASMAIAANGKICGDQHLLSAKYVTHIYQNGSFRLANAAGWRATASLGPFLPNQRFPLSGEAAQSDGETFSLRAWGFNFDEDNFPHRGLVSRKSCSVRVGPLPTIPSVNSGARVRIEAFSGDRRLGELFVEASEGGVAQLPSPADRLQFNLLFGAGGSAGIEQTQDTQLRAGAANIEAGLDAAVLSGDWTAVKVLADAAREGESLQLSWRLYTEYEGKLQAAVVFCANRAPGRFEQEALSGLIGTPLLQDASLWSTFIHPMTALNPDSGLDAVDLSFFDSYDRSYWVDPGATATASSEPVRGTSPFTASCNAGLNNLGVSIACSHNAPGARSFELRFEQSGERILGGSLTADQDTFTADENIRNWPLGQPTPGALPRLGSAGALILSVMGPSEPLAVSRIVWR